MTFSQDGNKLLVAVSTGVLDLFDVDRCTGLLSNWQPLGQLVNTGPGNWYGCSFSEDGTKAYASDVLPYDLHLYQWDLTAPNIPASKTLIYHDTSNTYWGQNQLGPDGKIYITQASPDTLSPSNFALSVIHDPNAAGGACNFQYLGVPLHGRRTSFNLPNLPNYSLGSLLAQQAEAGPSLMICPGAMVQLGMPDTSGGAVTFAWNGPNLDDSTAAQPLATPDTTSWYFLTVTDTVYGAPCGVSVDSVLVVVADSAQLPAAIGGIDRTVCVGDTISIGTSGNSGFSYHWSAVPVGNWIGSPDSAVTLVSGAGSYFLTVVNPSGVGACFAASDVVKVTEYNDTLPAGFAGGDSVICAGDTLRLGGDAPNSAWVFDWVPSVGLDDASLASPLASPVGTTTYFLEAHDTSFVGWCAAGRDTVSITVENQNLQNLPNLQDVGFCVGECFLIGDVALEGLVYAWSPVEGLASPNLSMSKAQPAGSMVYTLTVVDPSLQSLHCRERRFVVHAVADACNDPSFVAVNGDGVAEVLDFGEHAGRVSLRVVDLAGRLVYRSDDYHNDWSASALAHGVYVYRVEVLGDCPRSFVGKFAVLK